MVRVWNFRVEGLGSDPLLGHAGFPLTDWLKTRLLNSYVSLLTYMIGTGGNMHPLIKYSYNLTHKSYKMVGDKSETSLIVSPLKFSYMLVLTAVG